MKIRKIVEKIYNKLNDPSVNWQYCKILDALEFSSGKPYYFSVSIRYDCLNLLNKGSKINVSINGSDLELNSDENKILLSLFEPKRKILSKNAWRSFNKKVKDDLEKNIKLGLKIL